MSLSGRYYIKDGKTGRVFCIEPLSERSEKVTDKTFVNGGASGDAEKNKSQSQGGSIHEEESIITPENGFNDIRIAPKGVSPMDIIHAMLNE